MDLGVDPTEALASVLTGDELALVLPLGDGRHAQLPALLKGRTFTHRLRADELEHGYLSISPDLEPVSILTTTPAIAASLMARRWSKRSRNSMPGC